MRLHFLITEQYRWRPSQRGARRNGRFPAGFDPLPGVIMRLIVWAALMTLVLIRPIFALDGTVGIHDPSTVVECGGKWYVYGTGGTPLVSDDGWTWRPGVRAARTGAAPDVIKIGGTYY